MCRFRKKTVYLRSNTEKQSTTYEISDIGSEPAARRNVCRHGFGTNQFGKPRTSTNDREGHEADELARNVDRKS